VEGSSEHRNEPSGFIKFWGNCWMIERLLTSQEGLSSMELVRWCCFFELVIKRRSEYRDYVTSMIRWIINVERFVDWKLAGEAKYMEKPRPIHFVHQKSHITWPTVLLLYVYSL
jgi:hypothetical protein